MTDALADTARDTTNKTDAAYARLRQEILSGRFPPKRPLPIRDLTNLFGYGWTPLREALSRLEAESLVVSEHNRGFSVAPVSRDELEDLQRVRFMIEAPMLAESIEKGGDAWEGAVVAAHHLLSKCAMPFDVTSAGADEAWEMRHDAFHQALLSGCTSPWLHKLRNMLASQLMRHHRALTICPARASSAPQSPEDAKHIASLRHVMGIEHHTQLMQAAIARDTPRAIEVLRAHIGFTLDVFEVVERTPPSR